MLSNDLENKIVKETVAIHDFCKKKDEEMW